MPRQRRANVMAVPHVDDDQNPAARIAPDNFQDLPSEVRRVRAPDAVGITASQPGDYNIQEIGRVMAPAFVDRGRIERGAL